MKKVFSMCLLMAAPFLLLEVQAQTSTAKKIAYGKGKGPTDFPQLIFTKIKGAPTLQMPQLIMAETGPVVAEGHGYAAPAWFDIDNNGKKDLLLGEFGSGIEHKGMPNGNFIRVYENEGTNEQPRFTDEYSYARHADEFNTTGTPLSVYAWCCMGFTPKIVDLDSDGYPDIVTGQYNPGVVTWFRGSETGFLPGKPLPQFGEEYGAGRKPDHKLSRKDPKSVDYWNYSAVDFGDFEGRGLQDMIVGGSELRISKNTGTKTQPSFGRREPLRDVNGQPLKIGRFSEMYKNDFGEPYYGSSMVPTVADWDEDGIPDLLVTDIYVYDGSPAITFFRAVKTPEGLRFEPGVPLFTAKNGGKTFPGAWLRVCVADYNNDGVNDLIVGANVAELSGKFDHELSWTWEEKTGITKKNPAYSTAGQTRLIEEQMRVSDSIQAAMKKSDEEMEKIMYPTRRSLFKHYYGKEEYKKLAHKGYVYVLLGKRD